MSSTASRYAQGRRNQETSDREALQQIIPQRYLDNVPERVPKANASSNVFVAARAFIQDLLSRPANSNNTSGDTTGDAAANTTDSDSTDAAPGTTQTPQQSPQQPSFAPINPTTPEKLKNNPEYQYLKQVWERIKHNLQTRAEGEEISDEVKGMMNEANDALVDIIHKWEGDRAEEL
ncbi:hypothetical protein H2200_009500 [Cladophialophora chaetospira]|uniref:Uncharacterized protein n=1 Tax=Cladophialophora chaetospira TaxID=386627 RepID=A0AA38X2J8_9EURO|nr:hypothetical protein H2200_009500 [Cladophialophora chaetospira]